jgi:hypothetical protein
MTEHHNDQASSNAKPLLKRNDRFILGAVIFVALLAGFYLYNTRKDEDATNQLAPISAPETPAVPSGRK